MATRNTLELIDVNNPPEESYPVGTLLEIIYDRPALQRRVNYIGRVLVRPEEKAKQSVVTRKYGPERIIPVAATYTIKPLSMKIEDYIVTEDGLEVIQTTNCPSLATLIFDPTKPAFTVTPAPESVPQPRVQL